MAIFSFDSSQKLGTVRSVDTRRVDIQVNSDEDLRKARVGHLAAIALPGAIEEWLIGVIERVVKTPISDEPMTPGLEVGEEPESITLPHESVFNSVRVSLVGAVGLNSKRETVFSRSLMQVPEIDATCHILQDAPLQAFMALLSVEKVTESSLKGLNNSV